MSGAAEPRDVRAGLAAAAGAYALWGLTPLFYKLLTAVPLFEVVAQRAVWSVPAAGVLALGAGKIASTLDILRDRRNLGVLALASFFMGANWSIYIFAINTDRVLEASLGYYINPLMTVALGVLVLREAIRPLQIAALGLAAAGVLTMTIAAGETPVLGLGLAITFAIYGYLKKKLTVDPTTGLFIEMVVLAGPCLLLLAALYGEAAPRHDSGAWMLLALSGPVSVLPLALFAIGAQRLRLTTLGLLQYLAPTIMFGLGLAYGEAFTPAHAATFGLIWTGLALFTWDARRAQRSL